MIKMLKDWTGTFEVNGVQYDDFTKIPGNLQFNADWSIKLHPKRKNANLTGNNGIQEGTKKEVRITVKKYMTKHASPEFDFMARWNNDNPMPLRTMTGYQTKETRGMVYMVLHGDIWAEKICTCMCCGKKLTNPVSQYIGLGPECGKVIHMSLTEDDMANIKELASQAKKELVNLKWSGWIIKSAITEEVEV